MSLSSTPPQLDGREPEIAALRSVVDGTAADGPQARLIGLLSGAIDHLIDTSWHGVTLGELVEQLGMTHEQAVAVMELIYGDAIARRHAGDGAETEVTITYGHECVECCMSESGLDADLLDAGWVRSSEWDEHGIARLHWVSEQDRAFLRSSRPEAQRRAGLTSAERPTPSDAASMAGSCPPRFAS